MGKKMKKKSRERDEELESEDRAKPNDSKSSKSRGKEDGRVKDEGRSFIYSEGKPSNDPRWYLNNPVLARDVGSIWFSRPTGQEIASAMTSSTLPTYVGCDVSGREPGLMMFETMLTWGGNSKVAANVYTNSAINVSASKLYQYVVHANSRNTTYDAKSLMMSIMAVDAIYQVITEAVRAYRLINMYSFENNYIGMLLNALGWDPDECRKNVAFFRFTINQAINRVNKFFVPMLFDIVRAHQAAYQNLFWDRPSTKAQIFATKSAGVWEYRPVTGELVYTRTPNVGTLDPSGYVDWGGKKTPNDFYLVVSAMLNNIESAQHMGVMQGDMLKAFGMGAMMQYEYVGIDEAIYPIYDEEFLFKIHNAEIPNISTLNAAYTIGQDGPQTLELCKYADSISHDGGIFSIHSKLSNKGWGNVNMEYRHYIDLPAGLASTADNTLLMTLYKKHPETPVNNYSWYEGATAGTFYVSDLNPEEILCGYIYTKASDFRFVVRDNDATALDSFATNGVVHWLDGNGAGGLIPGPIVDTSNIDWLPAIFATIPAWSRFRKAPMMILPWVYYSNDKTHSTFPGFVWDTDNYVEMPSEILTRCNYVIWWSLWASSIIGNLT